MKKILITIMFCCLPLLSWAQKITFADATVEALCLDNWDTNFDGELSVFEAAAVKDLGTVFQGIVNITSFDELQYFIGLTSIGDYAFSDCKNLTSIVFPEDVTSIGNYAFSNCQNLTNIVIPENVTSIGNYAFYRCFALISVNIPDGVTSIGDGAFRHCLNLTSVTIPSSVTYIGDYAFSGCI